MIGILRHVAFVSFAALILGCRSVRPPEFTSEPESPDVIRTNAIAESYRLHTGDMLSLSSPDYPPVYEARIDADGNFNVPSLGAFRAAGKTIAEARDNIVKKDPRYQNYSLMICGCELLYYVTGKVQSAGLKPFQSAMTVFQAITAAGGFTKFAETNKVQLLRARGKRVWVRLTDTNSCPLIFNGDTVVVSRKRAAR
jgi:protein involved in polysaccharide export with SLBB domain